MSTLHATPPARAETPLTDMRCSPVVVGVGIDTSRYGHYAAFLRDDLQPAAADLQFAESAKGYAGLRERLGQIAQRHGAVHFIIRLDAAGQYADNLLHFLHGLGTPGADVDRLANVTINISCGDPQRNKNYRAALFGNKKSDPIEARAAARYAVSERPAPTPPLPAEMRTLRQVAGRLQAVVRQRTRLINQFHHLLALGFPELALLIKDIAAGWVLELVHRYPTAQLLATATPQELGTIPYLPDRHIDALLEHARSSIGSQSGSAIEELLRDQVRQLRDVRARQKRLENLLISVYSDLPAPNHLDSITGIGAVTAAVLTAFILDIDRFETDNRLVAYFGVLPIEVASGVDRDGQARGPRRYVMSQRGNDLVRRYLWMAALSAVQHNPAVRALYARVVAKHPDKKAIAVGHAMRKLLHLVFAIWKSGKPFDPSHYHWDKPNHVPVDPSHYHWDKPNRVPAIDNAMSVQDDTTTDVPMSANIQAAGHKMETEPARKVVTAARNSVPLAPAGGRGDERHEHVFIDFAHLKRQLTMAQVLDHLGLSSHLRGSSAQRRGPCPIHRGDGRGRTFSVNLDDNVFQCFDAACQKKGDVIDLWASVNAMSLRQAAIDLVRTFNLEPAPVTEKRQG
jgi:transposase